MKRLPWWRRPYFSRRVLEIGPGHNPFAGVTHLLERNIADGRERGGHALVVPTAAKLILGEATVLPFAADSFDFVYASHILEHVESPEAACREIMRVGRAGYIETPSPFLEQGLALRDESCPDHWFHRWFVFSPSPGCWPLSRNRSRKWAGFVPVRTASFSANSMTRWISGKPSISFAGHRKPPSFTGRHHLQWRRAITSWIAGRRGNPVASRA